MIDSFQSLTSPIEHNSMIPNLGRSVLHLFITHILTSAGSRWFCLLTSPPPLLSVFRVPAECQGKLYLCNVNLSINKCLHQLPIISYRTKVYVLSKGMDVMNKLTHVNITIILCIHMSKLSHTCRCSRLTFSIGFSVSGGHSRQEDGH